MCKCKNCGKEVEQLGEKFCYKCSDNLMEDYPFNCKHCNKEITKTEYDENNHNCWECQTMRDAIGGF